MTFGNSSPQRSLSSTSSENHVDEWDYHGGDLLNDDLNEPETVMDAAMIDDTFGQRSPEFLFDVP
jgi:hypothetical protein